MGQTMNIITFIVQSAFSMQIYKCKEKMAQELLNMYLYPW